MLCLDLDNNPCSNHNKMLWLVLLVEVKIMEECQNNNNNRNSIMLIHLRVLEMLLVVLSNLQHQALVVPLQALAVPLQALVVPLKTLVVHLVAIPHNPLFLIIQINRNQLSTLILITASQITLVHSKQAVFNQPSLPRINQMSSKMV